MNDEQLKRGNELKKQIGELDGLITITEHAGTPHAAIHTQADHPVIVKIASNHFDDGKEKAWLKEGDYRDFARYMGRDTYRRIANVARLMILQELVDLRAKLQAEYDAL